MKLKKSKYKGFLPVETDKWGYYSLRFQGLNLIIANDNKIRQRIMPNILQFVREIRKEEAVLKGYRELIFENNNGEEIKYKHVIAKTILEEEVYVDAVVKMHRDRNTVSLFSHKKNSFIEIKLPKNQLTISSDLSKSDFPHLSDVQNWAETFYCFDFVTAESFKPPKKWTGTNDCPGLADDLRSVMSTLQYDIEEVVLCEQGTIAGTQLRFNKSEKLISVADMMGNLKSITSLLILSMCLKRSSIPSYTLLIDNFGEDLQNDTAAKACKYLFDSFEDTRGQLIVITKRPDLLEYVEMKYWHILYNDEDKIIRSRDYENSRYKFRKLHSQGFENFDAIF